MKFINVTQFPLLDFKLEVHSLKMAMSCRNMVGYSQSFFLVYHLHFFLKHDVSEIGSASVFRQNNSRLFLNLGHGRQKTVCVRHTPLSKACSVKLK